MKPLPKNYDHKEAEPRLQKQWEEGKVYAWDESQPRENTFVIDTPPPTVSGILHMGHIFSYTQADFVARYQRMSGKTVFYPMGFDDNGLPTERLVEKEKKVRGSAMPREEFVALCREVVKGAEDEFRRLFKSTGLSVDWDQEYQTISDDVRALSQASFLDLLKKNEAYRDFRPTYWDWVDQTAIAQAEIENKEMPGVMNEILFALEDGTPLHIATTRPELLGACVAVMYHPEDANAAKYEGKTAITPVFGVKVPMIADDAVEQGKGTGLVMCCTFGDDTDKEWWRTHELPSRPIISKNGKMEFFLPQKDVIIFFGGKDGKNDTVQLDQQNCIDINKTISAFHNAYITFSEEKKEPIPLKIKPANASVIKLLQAEGKLLKQDNIVHTVKCAERSGTPIEIIPTYQWFVKVIDKKDALKAKGAECNWNPEFMKIRLNQWIEGLKEDWCISRQRFFGVSFPVWYVSKTGDLSGEIIPATFEQLTKKAINPLVDLPDGIMPVQNLDYSNGIRTCVATKDIYNIEGKLVFKGDNHTHLDILGDKDVMDTWATSSVSPQISAHGIGASYCKEPERYAKLFPADLRPQAHEIIRTWAFYTIVKAYLHEKSIPWKNLMISGWCLAADKTKMSKSKGNVVTPVDLILDKGADVVRYWASTSRLGADTAFSEDLLKIGRKLVTKLWNATAFAAIHLTKLDEIPGHPKGNNQINEVLDKWILTRLHKTIAKATLEFERFEYCDARVAVEDFFWKDFCDNYLELVKARAYGETGNTESQYSAHLTLYHCLNAILRLFAPFIPHITEELYSHIFEGHGSIHQCGTWPKFENYPVDKKAEEIGGACVTMLEVIRKHKSESNLSIKFPIRELTLNPEHENILDSSLSDLKAAGNILSVKFDSALKLHGYKVVWGEAAQAS